MQHEKKINYMKIAAGICGFGFTCEQLDLLTSIYDKVLVNEGDTNLREIAEIEVQVSNREKERLKKEKIKPKQK